MKDENKPALPQLCICHHNIHACFFSSTWKYSLVGKKRDSLSELRIQLCSSFTSGQFSVKKSPCISSRQGDPVSELPLIEAAHPFPFRIWESKRTVRWFKKYPVSYNFCNSLWERGTRLSILPFSPLRWSPCADTHRSPTRYPPFQKLHPTRFCLNAPSAGRVPHRITQIWKKQIEL